MSEQEMNLKIGAKLDTSEAEKELQDFVNKKRKLEIDTELDIDKRSTQKQFDDAIGKTQKQVKKNPVEVGVEYKAEKNSIANLTDSANKVFSLFTGTNALDFGADKIREAVGELKELNTTLVEIDKTGNLTKGQLSDLGNDSFDAASKWGALVQDYLSSSETFAQAGFSNLEEMSDLSTMAQVAGNMTEETATNFLIASDAAWQMKGNVENLTSVLDGMNMITNKNALNMTDLVNGIRVAGSMLANSGLEEDQAAALVGTGVATTKDSGETVARGLRTIIMNLRQVKGETDDGEIIDTEQLEKVEATCASVGVSLKTVKDGIVELRNPVDILRDLSEVYNSLDTMDARRAQITDDIAGKHRSNILSSILTNFDLYDKMLQDYASGSGSAMNEAMKTADSWEGRLNSLSNSWLEFVNNFAQADVMKGGVSFLDGMISSFDKLQDAGLFLPTLVSSVMALRNVFTGNGISDISFNKDAKGLNKFDVQGNLFGINLTANSKWKSHFAEAEKEIARWNKDVLSGQTSVEDFNTTLKDSKGFINYISNVKDGTASLDGYKAALKETGEYQKVSMKSVLANAATGFAVSAAIELGLAAITKIADETIYKQDRLSEKVQESASAYSSTISEVQSLNSELETTQARIAELKSQDKLLPDEEAELAQLERQNALLKTQLEIKQNLADTQEQQAAEDARKSIDYASERTFLYDENGDVKMSEDGMPMYGTINRKEYVRQQIEEMEKAQAQIEEAEKKLAEENISDKDRKKYTNQFENATENLKKYREEASTVLAELNEEADSFYDKQTGRVIAGFEKDVQAINDLNSEFNNFGLSDIEKQSAALESFFNGSTKSNAIKEKLIEATKSGEDVVDVLHDMGLTLGNLGLEGEGKGDALRNYFDGLVKSAKEAQEAISGVDGSFEGVEAAFESEDAGARWDKMADFIEQANEIYKKGEIGTDDFQTVVQWAMPNKINEDAYKYDAQAYKAAWESVYPKLQRWFDAENPVQSMWNFADDLYAQNASLFKTLDKEAGEIEFNTDNFKSTAQAAEELGVNAQVIDAVLHNLEDYGFEFDDIMFSGEGLQEYESALEGIRSIYDSMDSGASKDRLDKLLEGWDKEYAGFEADLSTLTEDQIIHIEFEYDMAQLQSEIDELQRLADEGDNTAKAALNAKKSEYRDKMEAETGYDESDDEGYSKVSNAVSDLKKQLHSAKGDDARGEIQDQISAIYDLQTAFQNFRDDGGKLDWNTYLQSDQAQEVLNGILESTGMTKDEMYDILGTEIPPVHIVVEGEVNAKNISEQVEKLDVGGTITFTADVGGVESEVEGIKNEDGSVTYTAEIGGVETEVKPIMNLDGSVTFEPITDKVDAESSKTDGGTRNTSFNPLTGALDAETAKTNGGTRRTIYTPDTSGLPSFFPAISRTVNYVVNWIGEKLSGGNSLGGTAYKSGTVRGFHPFRTIRNLFGRAFASGTFQDTSWLKPRWRTKKDNVALTGEEGQELVATREGHFFTVGDKGAEFAHIPAGSVVFNAKQTKELLSKGHINSRGRAHLSGTAYLNGGMLPTPSNNYQYTGTSSSNSSSTKAAQQATQATEDALEAISDYFDWIKIRYDRLARETEISEDSIDTAIGLSAKQASTAETIRKVQAELNAAQQGADRYLSHAKWYANQSGLSVDLQQRVQNGTIDINKYDDDTKKKIQEYQNWYENYLESLDKARELQQKEVELAERRLENIKDFYDLVVKVHESLQDANDSALELNDAMGFSAVSDAVKKVYTSSIEEAQQIYDNLSQQLSDYETEFNELVSKGYIKEYSDSWYEAKAQINEFKQAVDDSAVSLIEFQDKLREVEYTKIQQLIDTFERVVDKLDSRIDLMEARDETVPESIYQKQLDANNAQIKSNYDMREAKLAEQAYYAVDSTRYQELADEINKLDTEIYGLMTDNEKLKDSIFELRFKPLDDAIDSYDKLNKEISNFMDLINEDAYFDKQGRITSDGVAALALLSQNLETSKQKIADLRTGLDKLQESFDNGVISEVEFTEKSEEYRESIQDTVKDINSYSESLTKLYLNQMKQENEYLQEIIDKRKKALKAKADYYDYDRKIQSQSKDINMLKSQIAALEGVNNVSAQAQLKKLKQELADAEQELSDTKRNHAIEMQEQGYDTMSDELNEILSNTEYEITHNAEKQQSVIQSMLQNVVSMYSQAYSKINSIIANTGWVGSNDFNNEQSQLSNPVEASNQIKDATQHQSNVNSSGTAQSTVTDPINSNDLYNNKVEQELAKDPNTTNRPVAELKLSKTSVILQEGQSTTITASIRPTDAKNKTLSWGSSNMSIATVSNGTIKALKPGSCQIVASTTDGSGISVTVGVTVTKKPEPVKPVTPTQNNNSGGDGIARVGDVVTLKSGERYYYDSWGVSPAGNLYAGVPGGVVIDAYSGKEYGGQSIMHGDYAVHIKSADGKYGDLGWVRLSQLDGYASGSPYIDKDKWVRVNEEGDELVLSDGIVTMADGTVLRKVQKGDKILNNEAAQRFYDICNGDISPFTNIYNESLVPKLPEFVNNNDMKQNVTIDQHYDCLLKVEGNVDKDALPGLKELLEKSYQYNIQKMFDQGGKSGLRRRR